MLKVRDRSCAPPPLLKDMPPNYRYAPLRSAYAPFTAPVNGLRLNGVRPKGVRAQRGSTAANEGEYFGKRRWGVLGQASVGGPLGNSSGAGALIHILQSPGAQYKHAPFRPGAQPPGLTALKNAMFVRNGKRILALTVTEGGRVRVGTARSAGSGPGGSVLPWGTGADREGSRCRPRGPQVQTARATGADRRPRGAPSRFRF